MRRSVLQVRRGRLIRLQRRRRSRCRGSVGSRYESPFRHRPLAQARSRQPAPNRARDPAGVRNDRLSRHPSFRPGPQAPCGPPGGRGRTTHPRRLPEPRRLPRVAGPPRFAPRLHWLGSLGGQFDPADGRAGIVDPLTLRCRPAEKPGEIEIAGSALVQAARWPGVLCASGRGNTRSRRRQDDHADSDRPRRAAYLCQPKATGPASRLLLLRPR